MTAGPVGPAATDTPAPGFHHALERQRAAAPGAVGARVDPAHELVVAAAAGAVNIDVMGATGCGPEAQPATSSAAMKRRSMRSFSRHKPAPSGPVPPTTRPYLSASARLAPSEISRR